MPTYVYACTECGHRFEQHQAFTDAALTECPVCGARLRKVFNSVGVVFKGSGFYRNDSRGSGAGTAAEASGAKESGKDSTKDAGSNGSKDSGSKDSGSKDSGSSSPATESSSSSSAAAPATKSASTGGSAA